MLYVSVGGCNNLTVMSSLMSTVGVLSVEPAQALAGDTITIKGSGFNGYMTATLGTQAIALTLINKSEASFIMPSGLPDGVIQLTLLNAGNKVASFGLLHSVDTTTLAVSTIPSTDICSDIVYKNSEGTVQNGTRNCSAAAVPLPPDCNLEGQTGCVTVTDFPAIDKRATLSAENLARMRVGVSIAGSAGTLRDCSTDNDIGCVSSLAFPSVVKVDLTPGLIKAGTTIAGISGNYPSAQYPLASTDGFPDLTAATFTTKLADPSDFAWFDSNGTRHSQVGSTNLDVVNIRSGLTLFGALGTYAPPCTTDGEVDCLATNSFKAAALGGFDRFDIRRGRTVAGVAGAMTMYRNLASLSVWDRSGIGSSVVGIDVNDTIDDRATPFPTTAPAGFLSMDFSHFIRDALSDTGVGAGVALNGACDGTEECVYADLFTGNKWARTPGSLYNWDAAIDYCEDLEYGGYTTGWRLPTQKELAQFYINGASSLSSPTLLNINSDAYWTSTSVTGSLAYAWRGDVSNGFMDDEVDKTANSRALCTR